ncbi:30S ribosomal protein S6 [Candidatus Uhrbacteria bacterium RIFOXYB12_FULL_58_10]|uniref:Small ribosomal subunit protein bS6 n=1 Tax=Candidatus Uhrbacteria bacterium RIFOXYB2_FULL_57_15 TaxID=1802422 RepID=A0A1F7W9K6_9BACT|nr:MAG: 30S ribosomal protein S6 [Candidatus Uhrbacteria bacterium RIFOXYB12_FULL_58_10]OGL99459.1 MAG: 30S ribosomal protein S6 [Candidatus Uhrbacteria bacterium RIFOXYB2_FULL_57_15]OGL99899.1 MAG: 30S ribosomal protein S6 [Candidatus Uhrbacteria bacterium RIFOXYC12_FULL_57_11]
MQKYELLYIVPTQFADTEIDGLREKTAAIIEQTGAKVTRNESLGKIKLAYPIKHQRHGTYVLIHFEGEPSVVATIDRALRLSDEVLRHMIVDLAPGSEKKVFEIQSYVAPLSEEAREMRRTTTSDAAAPRKAPVAPSITEAAFPVKAGEASMSMEELDKKLDEILDEDVKA